MKEIFFKEQEDSYSDSDVDSGKSPSIYEETVVEFYFIKNKMYEMLYLDCFLARMTISLLYEFLYNKKKPMKILTREMKIYYENHKDIAKLVKPNMVSEEEFIVFVWNNSQHKCRCTET